MFIKLHVPGDGVREASRVVRRRGRGDGQGVRGRMRRRRSRVLRWDGATASATAAGRRVSSEEVLQYGEIRHGCVHHLCEPVVSELGSDDVPTPELLFA